MCNVYKVIHKSRRGKALCGKDCLVSRLTKYNKEVTCRDCDRIIAEEQQQRDKERKPYPEWKKPEQKIIKLKNKPDISKLKQYWEGGG